MIRRGLSFFGKGICEGRVGMRDMASGISWLVLLMSVSRLGIAFSVDWMMTSDYLVSASVL